MVPARHWTVSLLALPISRWPGKIAARHREVGATFLILRRRRSGKAASLGETHGVREGMLKTIGAVD
jgi:hypothetical protein